MSSDADLAIIGCGAAGLMAAITAARSHPHARVIALDGAQRLGAKILVAGGGRCNVTHHAVDERAYAGSSPTAIRRVLRRFDVSATIKFFADLGIDLKREETGKLFPTTDDAHTVLDALLTAARAANVELRHPWRVGGITRTSDGFLIAQQESSITRAHTHDREPTSHFSSPLPSALSAASAFASITCRRLILATGGKSLPRTGSDGYGYTLAQSLGHTVTSRIVPALVPLTLPREHPLCTLSGLAVPATLDLRSTSNKKLHAFTNSLLFTHFGLSGPCALDISRYYTRTKVDDPGCALLLNVLPALPPEALDHRLMESRTSRVSIGRILAELPNTPALPERLIRVLCTIAGLDPTTPAATLTKNQRRAAVGAFTALPLPITGDRGYTYAEVTAGGVPLAELDLQTLESRPCPGLHLCGEILDVDGRIGGFNFQWAWASGYVAGMGPAASAPGT